MLQPQLLWTLRKDAHAAVCELTAHPVLLTRFHVSRFFVKIRKLAEQKSLSQDLIIAALDRGAIELFLEKVNPLDQAVRARAGKPPDEIDQRFFRALLQRYPADADGSEVMATDEPAAPS